MAFAAPGTGVGIGPVKKEAARRRPKNVLTLAAVIITDPMNKVWRVIAVAIPVMHVPRSAAPRAIDTFMTQLSEAIRHLLEASTARTSPEPVPACPRG